VFVSEKNNYHGKGVLIAILSGGVPPGSLNPDPISEQNMPFPTTINFSELASKIHTLFQTWFLKVALDLRTLSSEVNMSLKHFVII